MSVQPHSEEEGVIKYTLAFTQTRPDTIPFDPYRQIEAYRRLCWMTELIGQTPERYNGDGFGNISLRYGPNNGFLISGSQTGGAPHLGREHYAWVTRCFPSENRVVAQGPLKPSSESMTHGTLYLLDPGIGGVVHAHSPEIWRAAADLNLPMTSADAPYGSPEMALEVERLWHTASLPTGKLFGMAGHEDGIVSFGKTLEEATLIMLSALASALQLR